MNRVVGIRVATERLEWDQMLGPSGPVWSVTGRLQDDIEPFETRFRVEFHGEPHGRTRLEIRQWLPAHLARPSNQGWVEALEKLDATHPDRRHRR